MSVALQRSAEVTPTKPLTWSPDARPSSWAVCVCTNGHQGTLSREVHNVDAAGSVTPSYVCPTLGCAFHEWVSLAGWKP